jgi:CubicO group peptidase (beta-lactamase class C family)
MKNIIGIAVLFFCVSCGNSQEKGGVFLDRVHPENVGADPVLIEKLLSDIRTGKIRNIHGLVIIKDDHIFTEEYFENFSREKLHYTASVSKSFASALLGIAIDQGFFQGDIQTVLDRNVSELFPSYRDVILEDPVKSGFKLKHLLSMTAGFEWDEHTYPYSDPRNDCFRINHSDDPMKFLFERKLIHKPGTEFYYNGGLSLAISYLIETYTGKSVDRFAEAYLFKALGIQEYHWEAVTGGLIDTDGGLHLKPMDQAKLG